VPHAFFGVDSVEPDESELVLDVLDVDDFDEPLEE
jgi:hypothetical protein